MKRTVLSLSLAAATAAASLAPLAAHADHDGWDPWQSWEERRVQRENENAQRQLRRHQRTAEVERSMGIERPNPTIDHRKQRLPAAPAGHEWQTAPNGDSILVMSSTGTVVQVIRNVTPSGPVAP